MQLSGVINRLETLNSVEIESLTELTDLDLRWDGTLLASCLLDVLHEQHEL